MNDFSPDFWYYINPNAFEIFLKPKNRNKKDTIIQSLIAFLKQSDLEEAKICCGEGELIFEYDKAGNIKSRPVGMAIVDAYKNIVYSKK